MKTTNKRHYQFGEYPFRAGAIRIDMQHAKAKTPHRAKLPTKMNDIISGKECVFTFGSSDNGLAGNGGTKFLWTDIAVPTLNKHLSACNVIDVNCGKKTNIIITHDKTYCWGSCVYGNCVPGSAGTAQSRPFPIKETEFPEKNMQIVHSATSFFTTVALTSDGDVLKWGSLEFMKMNQDPTVDKHKLYISDTIEKIPSLCRRRIVQLAAGASHFMALNAGGTVYSWGEGNYGKLGHDDEIRLEKPKKENESLQEDTTGHHHHYHYDSDGDNMIHTKDGKKQYNIKTSIPPHFVLLTERADKDLKITGRNKLMSDREKFNLNFFDFPHTESTLRSKANLFIETFQDVDLRNFQLRDAYFKLRNRAIPSCKKIQRCWRRHNFLKKVYATSRLRKLQTLQRRNYEKRMEEERTQRELERKKLEAEQKALQEKRRKEKEEIERIKKKEAEFFPVKSKKDAETKYWYKIVGSKFKITKGKHAGEKYIVKKRRLTGKLYSKRILIDDD